MLFVGRRAGNIAVLCSSVCALLAFLYLPYEQEFDLLPYCAITLLAHSTQVALLLSQAHDPLMRADLPTFANIALLLWSQAILTMAVGLSAALSLCHTHLSRPRALFINGCWTFLSLLTLVSLYLFLQSQHNYPGYTATSGFWIYGWAMLFVLGASLAELLLLSIRR